MPRHLQSLALVTCNIADIKTAQKATSTINNSDLALIHGQGFTIGERTFRLVQATV